MLKVLRNKKLMKIIMWSLVVVFALWGAGSVATIKKASAGKIFNKNISIQQYNRSYLAVLNRAKMVYGDKLPKLEKFLNLQNQAWDRLILQYAAKKKHIRASNQEVVSQIASYPFLQRNGIFDERLYNYIIANVFQTTLRDFEETVRVDIIIDKLISSVAGDITVSDEDIESAYRIENEKGDISYVVIDANNYKNSVTVGDSEIYKFYEKNKNNFMSPAMVDTKYIRIPFNEDKEDARFTIDEILVYIKNKKTLSDASKEFGVDIRETGAFSVNSKIPEIGLSYPFVLAALRLEEGQVSDVVEISDAFCIIELKEKIPPKTLDFEQAKESAKDMLTSEKASSLARVYAEDFTKELGKEESSLEAISKNLGFNLISAKDITRKSYIEAIGPSEDFTNKVFDINVGDISRPLKIQKGYAIIRLDNLKPIDEEKFQKEKSDFTKTLLDKKKQEKFKAWFVELKKKANLKDNISN